MISHYLKPYWRNFKKSFLSLSFGIGGFALGMAVFTLCLLFISSETSFDKFNSNGPQIYRLVFGKDDAGGLAYTSHMMGQTVKDNFPGSKWVTFTNAGNARINFFNGNRKFNESKYYFTSPEVFDVFSFRLSQGDPASCLAAPFSAVLTPAAAARYFGEENPVGKTLKVDWAGTVYDLNITGLMEPPPFQSHLQFEFLISYATAEQIFLPKTLFTDWTANFQWNYVYLPEGTDTDFVARSLNKVYAERVPAEQRSDEVRFQPLERIHLHSKLSAEHSKNSDVTYVYIAASLGFLIIVICTINYLNILAALYARRLRELGIRKVLGARRYHIGSQFVLESMLNLLIAFGLSWLIIGFASPHFSNLLNSDISVGAVLAHPWIPLGSLAGIAAVISLYLVIFLSDLKPVSLIKGTDNFLSGTLSRSVMVGAQVSISLFLIVGSLSITRQIRFLENRELGFEKDQIVSVPYGRLITNGIMRHRKEFLNTTDITDLSLSSQIPSSNLNFKVRCFPEGGNPMKSDDPWSVSVLIVDHAFVQTYGLQMATGRPFSDDIRSDTAEAFMINESFAKELGWNEAVGKRIEINFNPGTGLIESKKGSVVGVVRDFHFESLHKPIGPVLFVFRPSAFFYASFRLTPGNTNEKVERLRTKWSSLFPDTPFDYFFVSDRVENVYRTEKSWARSIDIFSAAAILISCLGIYGLLSIILQRKVKEIAIRKIMGASGTSIMAFLSAGIFRVILVAFIVTLPFCFYAVNEWLNGFAYRAEISLDVFVISLVSFSAITLIVISGNLLKGARTSIVENLRGE